MDALEDVDGAVLVGCCDTQDVNRIHKPVDDSVAAFDADNELATGGGEGVVADEVGLGVGGWGFGGE